ncbi:zinc knuckle, partial [Ostertagia ostertagi]
MLVYQELHLGREENDRLPCFFCGKRGHTPKNCPEFQTREQRIEQMRKLSLCKNCGSTDHYASSCTGGACRICGVIGHHTSICSKLHGPTSGKPQGKMSPVKAKRTPVPRTSKAKQHTVSSTPMEQSTLNAETALCMKNTAAGEDIKSVVLVGKALVLNPHCMGMAHVFSVARIEHLTEPLQRHQLSDADKRYLVENDIELSIKPHVQDVQPQVLLGCSDTFALMDSCRQAQHTLPSGLKVIPSLLGYLITGQIPKNTDEGMSSIDSVVTLPQDTQGESEMDLTAHHIFSVKSPHSETGDELVDWGRHNSLSTAQGAVAFALRFLRRLCSRLSPQLSTRLRSNIPGLNIKRETRYVSAEERKAALLVIVRNHQNRHITEQLLKIDEHGLLPLLWTDEQRADSRAHEKATIHCSQNPTRGLYHTTQTDGGAIQKRYNLRNRPRVDYCERQQGQHTVKLVRSLPNVMLITMVVLLCSLSTTLATPSKEPMEDSLRCVKGGVQIVSRSISQYEVCSEDHCVVRKQPPPNETITFPPEITVHAHTVQWKVLEGTKVKVVETVCPAIPFCEHVQCWFCTATAFNPECNPKAALLVWTTVLYVFIAITYTLCYVPLTLGKPCRVMARFLMVGLRLILQFFKYIVKSFPGRWRRHRNRDEEVAKFLRIPLIAIAIAAVLPFVESCQDVDIMSMKTTVCSQSFPEKGKCWVEIDICSEYGDGRHTQSTVFLQPTVPIQHGPLKVTLSSVTIPPTPDLQSHFISNGAEIALWEETSKVTLQCKSIQQARELDCDVFDRCICQPAENRIRCVCEDLNITSGFHDQLDRRLPVRRPWITFRATFNNSVAALIPSLVTAEILLTFKGEVNTTIKELSDTLCTIPNTVVYGCYQCTQGAVAEVSCSSSDPTRAVVNCDENYFTVPCGPQGERTQMRFSRTEARIRIHCSVTCGARGSVRNIIEGESSISDEVWLPDFTHIFDTLTSGFGHFILAIASLLVVVGVSYFLLWTCGLKIALESVKLIFRIVWTITKILLWTIAWIIR